MRTATTIQDIPNQQELLSMSGLQFMQGVLSGQIASPQIFALMDFALFHVEKGRVLFRGTPAFSHTNPVGTIHGGWYGAILDSAMGCAVMTTVPKGSYYTTLEYKVNLTRSIPIGTEVVCEGTVQHAGRSTGVAVAELRGADDGRLYATGSTTCIIMAGK